MGTVQTKDKTREKGTEGGTDWKDVQAERVMVSRRNVLCQMLSSRACGGRCEADIGLEHAAALTSELNGTQGVRGSAPARGDSSAYKAKTGPRC